MNNRYILLTIVVIIIATMGAYSLMTSKQAAENKINDGIDKSKEQTKNNTAKQISEINEEIKKAQEIRDMETVRRLIRLQADLKAKEMGRCRRTTFNAANNKIWGS